MAARVTATEVKAIIETDLSDVEVAPFMTMATLIVDEQLADSDYSDDRLKEIERWLAAHFVAMRDPRTASESVAGMNDSFEGQTGKGYDFTRFGQQALLLDTGGHLSNKARAASIAVENAVS